MARVKELESLILRHKALYYQGKPEITDIEYDKYEEELKSISPQNPILNIVGSFSTGLAKVRHGQKMLSLAKTYKNEELISWIGEKEVVSMYKIDGVSCSLLYEDGKLAIAKTRGDGSLGENITNKILWLNEIPKIISTKEPIELRGELYCTEEKFFKVSNEMVALGLDKPTSQRNIVAGFMGRKENLEFSRFLSFQAFECISSSKFKYENEKMNFIKSLGFEVPELEIHKNTENISSTLLQAQNFMSIGEYQIDGLVFIYNDLSLHDELGETSHHPRYKMAFKFQGEAKQTTIKEIIWAVSRNGIATPVANVEVVELSGAMISRVTLHNFGMVKQNELKKGDQIEIIRSGEVIPKFLRVIKQSNEPFSYPKTCPSCSEKLFEEEIRLTCKNKTCPAIIKETILYYVQKIGIDDLSSKRLDGFIKLGLVKKIEDLYKLTEEDLLQLDKFQEKLASKIISSIEKSKNVDFVTFMTALGISGGAYNKCEKIYVNGVNSLEKLKALSLEKLKTIESFAEKSSFDFINSLNEKKELIIELENYGFNFEEKIYRDTVIKDKKICITGALSRKRSEIEGDIRENGGIAVSSVTKNTDFLLCNEESASSKYKKAITLEIPIITENDLKIMLE